MPMKKLILKTALITFGVAIVLAISVFGIVSLSAPYAMMKFTASIGLETISGDYAFQEYERSGSIECLARSFLIAAENGKYASAEDRFEKICGEEERFEQYCKEVSVPSQEGVPAYSYRDYVMGRAACVKYALKRSDAISFAVENTEKNFPAGNPCVALAAAAASAKDGETCSALASALRGGGFEESNYFLNIVSILEGVQ